MNFVNRWYLDTEFVEDGVTIELASIGLVDFSGERTYYAVSKEWYEMARLSTKGGDDWFKRNVLPKLFLGQYSMGTALKSRIRIANNLLELFGIENGKATNGTPEIWADFASYDWVALCQLFGRMVDLPGGMPMYCNDLQQEIRTRGIRIAELPKEDPQYAHNALIDAQHLRRQHRYVLGMNW